MTLLSLAAAWASLSRVRLHALDDTVQSAFALLHLCVKSKRGATLAENVRG